MHRPGCAACQRGFRVRFFGVTGLIAQLLERREERQPDRFLKQFERVDLPVLDEPGYVPFSILPFSARQPAARLLHFKIYESAVKWCSAERLQLYAIDRAIVFIARFQTGCLLRFPDGFPAQVFECLCQFPGAMVDPLIGGRLFGIGQVVRTIGFGLLWPWASIFQEGKAETNGQAGGRFIYKEPDP